MLTTMPIPDSDDTLDLAPTDDGLGYAASITRRGADGSGQMDSHTAGGYAAGRMDGRSTGRPPCYRKLVVLLLGPARH
jgi:hypothetical protein